MPWYLTSCGFCLLDGERNGLRYLLISKKGNLRQDEPLLAAFLQRHPDLPVRCARPPADCRVAHKIRSLLGKVFLQ
eukprot:12924108-Prorocentrum_lima.AAC.1